MTGVERTALYDKVAKDIADLKQQQTDLMVEYAAVVAALAKLQVGFTRVMTTANQIADDWLRSVAIDVDK
jgi:hypothetical protein